MNKAGENHIIKRCLLGLIVLGIGSFVRVDGRVFSDASQRWSDVFFTEEKPAFLLSAVANHNKTVTLMTVDAKEQWQLAVAAPIAARIRHHKKIPILMATAPEGLAIQSTLMERLTPDLNSYIVMDFDGFLKQVRGRCAVHVLPKASDCAQTALLAAMSFWQSADVLIVGAVDDPEAAILGSTLASHLSVPFVPISGRENPKMISEGLEILNVKRVVFVTSSGDFNTIPVGFSNYNTEVLSTNDIQKRLIKAIGQDKIRNIILFRVPEVDADDDAVSWLVPYLSLMRNSAVVSCSSSNPYAAEEKVGRFIETYSLKPRTATILADKDLIGMMTESYGTEPNEYEVLIEPCSRSAEDRATVLGVGRIPYRDIWAASTLIARGIAGDYVLHRAAPKVLMIANPSEEYGSLPLCETVSRATAQEFKNFRIHTDEFYGVPCHDPKIRNLALGSQLIIYEGHITEFSLFENPSIYPDDESYYGEEWGDGRSDDFVEVSDPVSDPSEYPGRTSYSEDETEDVRTYEQLRDDQSDPDERMEDIHDQEVYDRVNPPVDPCQLEGLPLIILQSCHSLDDSALQILRGGSVAVLGSATNIHSSSGSALVKAFCDGLLYRGETMGLTLRDARNYLLCVAALKTARGHKEQAKVLRVAYGFHLWGDPECKLFNGLSSSPRIKPVSADFIAPDKIRIVVPKRRLPTSRTEKYFLRMYPGSEVAGIVKRLKDKEIRRITPIYFFRLDMPKEAALGRYTGLKRLEDTTTRAVFLVDSFKRYLYILYFPEKEEAGQTFILQFME